MGVLSHIIKQGVFYLYKMYPAFPRFRCINKYGTRDVRGKLSVMCTIQSKRKAGYSPMGRVPGKSLRKPKYVSRSFSTRGPVFAHDDYRSTRYLGNIPERPKINFDTINEIN